MGFREWAAWRGRLAFLFVFVVVMLELMMASF
jgi:hypothetical protein